MGKLLVLISLILLVCIQGLHGCLEEERKALLALKEDFFRSFHDDDHSDDSVLSSWIKDPRSDCCHWEQVTCNFTTGHVIKLSLDNLTQAEAATEKFSANWNQISLFQSFEQLRILNLSLNHLPDWNTTAGYSSFSRLQRLEKLDLASNVFSNGILLSLSALTSLEYLSLRDNQFEGSVPNQDLKAFGKLRKLKYIDLSENHFNNHIMKFLGTFPSLSYVDLSTSDMEGPLIGHGLDRLSNLEVLNLRFNQLSGALPLAGSFKKLKILDLSHNNFSSNIGVQIGALSSLKKLYLSYNSLHGYLPAIPGLCQLKKLQELDLSYNSLEGNLPPCLNNLTSLKLLDLSINQFNGTISSNLMSSLTSLEYINLGQNSLEGMLPFNSSAYNSKLKVVILGWDEDERNNLHIVNQGNNAVFQLEILGFSNCNLTSIPKFLDSQHQLKAVDLSHNKLKGKFPAWLLESNAQLGALNVRNNSFAGSFCLPHLMRNMVYFDISNNHFNGKLRQDIGQILPNLKYLNLSYNYFEGNLPSSIGGLKNLWQLDLSFNKFTGEVPKELTADCTELNGLTLSNNKFSGQLFSSGFNLSKLWSLKLNDNHFTGSLTNMNFKMLEGLLVLDVSNNNMTGSIPRSFAGLYGSLGILNMKNNNFEGNFPCLPRFLLFIDISHNFFSGPLPFCFKYSLEWDYGSEVGNVVINMEGNRFMGSIPDALFNSTNLQMLNLRNNRLSGSIPEMVGIPNIRILLLGNNDLSGLIPKELCELTDMSMMDLSNNSFYGSIPSCFSNIAFGSVDNSNLLHDNIDLLVSEIISFDFEDYFLKKVVFFSFNGLFGLQLEIYFTAKYLFMPYKGGILNFMSGLDLSCNNLSGRIPWSIGDLSSIHALNLSHNHFIGPIPISFSNLSQIESLDLSYNTLSGEIPLRLTHLNFLGAFSVSNNNLSGKIPYVQQLSTFDESSYEGNPFLCGKPLEKNCPPDDLPPQSPPATSAESEGKWYEVDHISFFGSLAATYIMFLLGFVTILYINPYWRRRWFNFIEDFIDSCYYYAFRIFYHRW